jgi:hypothetical protein
LLEQTVETVAEDIVSSVTAINRGVNEMRYLLIQSLLHHPHLLFQFVGG